MVNLVVYVSDALRTDHVGCYGARFVNTKTIDELAAGGVRFDQAISAAPWTCPSMTSMVSGRYPHHHGHLHWDADISGIGETLFTRAAAAGYRVASFVFDESYLFRGFPEANVLGTSESLDGAISWLREQGEGPFLLFVHSWATHMPYDVLHAERREWRAAKREVLEGIQSDSASALEGLRESYRQAVEHQSELLFASLLDELDTLGLRERTALAFLSDHGESWGERYEDKTAVEGVYHMHGSNLTEEIVQVPLILSAPDLEPAEIFPQVRSVDLVPTLLDLAGVASGELDGTSLLPLARGEETDDRPAVIAGTDRGALSKLALRRPPWKLVVEVETGEEEAYHLATDPRERQSRPQDVPPELRTSLYVELESAERREVSAEEEAIVMSRLADLGYI